MGTMTKTILILVLGCALNACGELQQDFSAPQGLDKSSLSENQDVMCAMILVPMFNPQSTACVEAKDACEANELKRQGFMGLSLKDYCDMGCSSESCKNL